MDIRFSVLARDRRFSKAMDRLRPLFAPLLKRFSLTELESATHSAILVGITDDKGPEYFQIVPNKDGYFQILVGCEMKNTDIELAMNVYNILYSAALAYPFSITNMKSVISVFVEFIDSTSLIK